MPGKVATRAPIAAAAKKRNAHFTHPCDASGSTNRASGFLVRVANPSNRVARTPDVVITAIARDSIEL
jgi:hypothetical protein